MTEAYQEPERNDAVSPPEYIYRNTLAGVRLNDTSLVVSLWLRPEDLNETLKKVALLPGQSFEHNGTTYRVFIDNKTFTYCNGRRVAYKEVNLGGAVPRIERIAVQSVDDAAEKAAALEKMRDFHTRQARDKNLPVPKFLAATPAQETFAEFMNA